MTKELLCIYLGSARPIDLNPDSETMFQTIFKKNFSLSVCDLIHSDLVKFTQESIKINTIKTKTLVALIGSLKSISHWLSS